MSFTAVYPGRCNACDDPIHPGQTIAEDDGGGYSHLRCLWTDDEPGERETPCPHCRLIHRGECF